MIRVQAPLWLFVFVTVFCLPQYVIADSTASVPEPGSWANVKAFAMNPENPRQERIDKLNGYLESASEGDRHVMYAEKLRKRLERGGEVEGAEHFDDRSVNRYYDVALGFGTSGFNLTMGFFTLKWPRFYWTIVRGTFHATPGGWIGGHGGTGAGWIAPTGPGEIRIGLSLEFGLGEMGFGFGDGKIVRYGPCVVPEIAYHFRPKKKVNVYVRFSAYIFFLSTKHLDEGGDITSIPLLGPNAGLAF